MPTIRRSWGEFTITDAQVRAILTGEVRDALKSEADKRASRARSTAPVDSGEYRDGIRVETDATKERARARVVASAAHSRLIEAKTGNLKRALGG